MLWFEDPIAFRYAYESRFRGREQEEERKGLVVLAQVPAAELDKLPYDILAKASRLTFGLAELFPKLNGAVVSTLEPADLDALYDAHARHATEALGETATKEFALRHAFGIDAELVQTPVDLLRVLLQRHYPGRRVPPALDQWFIAAIQGRFEKWPLRNIVPDREAFFDFLQASNAADSTRLLRHPCMFPYRLPYWAASELVASSRQLEALRQGLDEEMLILRFPYQWQQKGRQI